MAATERAATRRAAFAGLAAFALALCACSESTATNGAVADGHTIPLLTAEQLAARIASCRGKPLLVNFWATWCAPCVAELPDFDAGTRAFRERGGIVLGVAMEFAVDGATPESARRKVAVKTEGLRLEYPQCICIEGDLIALREALDLELGALPQTVAYDRNGEVLAIHDGVGTAAEFESLARDAER